MKKKYLCILCLSVCLLLIFGCTNDKEGKIGVSLGSGSAARWALEKEYMEKYANELGMDIDVRLSKAEDEKTQSQHCLELLESDIDVLIIRPKNLEGMDEVVSIAKQKGVKVICYSGLLDKEENIDLFIGYDCEHIGSEMAKFLTEMVYEGDYIVLSGDKDDKYVSDFMYKGAMKYIDEEKLDIRILLDTNIVGWKPDYAKTVVREAIEKNNHKVDAIFAPNDSIAQACVEVLEELGISEKVVITGMDAQLSAVQRIVEGKQASTIYMDSKTIAKTAVEQAYNMMSDQEVEVNATIDNGSGKDIPCHLITGKLIVKENIDRILVEQGVYTKEEVYGK